MFLLFQFCDTYLEVPIIRTFIEHKILIILYCTASIASFFEGGDQAKHTHLSKILFKDYGCFGGLFNRPIFRTGNFHTTKSLSFIKTTKYYSLGVRRFVKQFRARLTEMPLHETEFQLVAGR